MQGLYWRRQLRKGKGKNGSFKNTYSDTSVNLAELKSKDY